MLNDEQGAIEIYAALHRRAGEERDRVATGSDLDVALMRLCALLQRLQTEKEAHRAMLEDILKDLQEAGL